MIRGTYIGVAPFHLGAYVDEEVFRFNQRGDDDGGRFDRVVRSVAGRRIDYKTFTGKLAHGLEGG